MKSRFGKRIAAGAIALGLSLLVAPANSQAQSNFYWAGSASANWADASQWNLLVANGGVTSLVNGVDWPGDPSDNNDANSQLDTAWFTNSGTFNVSVASPVPAGFFIGSNMFDNASGTVMNVSINIGSGIDFRPGGGDSLVVGEKEGATGVVSITTSGGTLDTGFDAGTMYIGKNGYGTLYLTNTYAYASGGGNYTLGDGTNGVGLLVIAGPTTLVFLGETGGGHLNVGGGNSSGNTVILSNSAVLSAPDFRVGSTAGNGTSNNLMIVDSHALLFIAGGNAVVGNREKFPLGTNTPAINNTLIFQNGGYGDTSNHTFSVGWADNDVDTHPVSSTGNVVIVQAGSALTNMSHCIIQSNNAAFVYGGVFGGGYGTNATHQLTFDPFSGSITNAGSFTCWGTLQGSTVNATGGVMIVSNNVGALTVTHNFQMQTGSVLQVSLGSSYNTISVGSNVTLNGTINFIDSGGFDTVGNHTYTLFTGNFYTNSISGTTTNPIPYYADTNNLAIGTVPNPSATYTISLPDFHTVNLVVGGFVPLLPFQITSITRTPTVHDLTINWNTRGSNGQTNFVQASSGSANGSYPGTLVDIATNIIAGATASFVDTGGATNKPARYYRVRSPQ